MAVRDLRYTDVIVLGKFLSGYTAMAISCCVVVLFALVNDRNTLIKS